MINQISPVNKVSTLEQATLILKDFITSGHLKPGEYLPPEIELSKQLGVGRSTLREAMKMLELQGFIRKILGVGVMVVEESDKAATDMLQMMLQRSGSSFKELAEVRSTIELKTTELAIRNATDDDIALIGECVEIMQGSITKQEEYIKADMNFHMAIAQASHNNLFTFILQSIRPLIQEMIESTLQGNHRLGYRHKVENQPPNPIASRTHRPLC
jgi:GntR family transcriptional repressor for pyruvate dehydrogenase complex